MGAQYVDAQIDNGTFSGSPESIARVREEVMASYPGTPTEKVFAADTTVFQSLTRAMIDGSGAAGVALTTPIPGRDGSIQRLDAQSLSDVQPGRTVTVVEVEDRDPELLRYLGDLKLYPGTRIEVLKVEPYEGPFVLRMDDREIILGRAAAIGIRVSK